MHLPSWRKLWNALLLCGVSAIALGTGSALARDRPLVWALHGPSNTVYIAGSMHLLRSEDSALSDNLNRAYDDAERIVMEVDMDDLDETAMTEWTMRHGAYPAGSQQSLRSTLGEARWQKFNAQSEAAGLPLAAMDQYKPWMVAITFSLLELQKLGLDPKLGVEKTLTTEARRDHKPVTGLETVEQQLSIFDGLTTDMQVKFLEQTLEESKDAERQLGEVTRAWRSGDEKALAKGLLDEYARFPELYQALVLRRNQAWIPQIKALLQGKDDFLVVVGALHLVGDSGVIRMLEHDGLHPQRMTH